MADRKAFEQAQKDVENLSQRPENEELLQLYGLYKQAESGDVSGDPPGGFNFKAVAKYRAWEKEKGKSGEKAMSDYINMVNALLEKYGQK